MLDLSSLDFSSLQLLLLTQYKGFCVGERRVQNERWRQDSKRFEKSHNGSDDDSGDNINEAKQNKINLGVSPVTTVLYFRVVFGLVKKLC